MARKLIDILREKGQFQDQGEPTESYKGLGTDQVTEAVDYSLEGNNYNPINPGPRTSGPDEDARSIIRALREAARNDVSLNEVLDSISNMDDLLFRELSKPYMGTAFTQGYRHNRYSPVGLGRQRSSNPVIADNERLQFDTDGGVREETLKSAGSRHVRDQVLNPPGGASQNRFREGILSSNSNDGVNEVLDFYGQNETTRPSIGTSHNNEFSEQRRALDSGANLSRAMDTPTRDSFLRNALKDNRFKPTGFNGLTPETYLGNTEYSPTGQVPQNYSADDLPFDRAELISSDQSNRNYYVSPRSVDGDEGGLAKVGDARIDQINQDNRLVKEIGSRRTIRELQQSLSQGYEARKSIFQRGMNFGDRIATSIEEIQNLRYFNLEENIDEDYFNLLEQQTGQFINNQTPGLRELSLSHLVYEMSKFHKGGPIPRNEPQDTNNILEGIGDSILQIGNRVVQEFRGELERLTGRSKEIARALMAPRGSSLREVLKTTEFTSGAFGTNSNAKGEQSQNSTDAIRARLRDTDNAMRRMFSASKNDEPLSTLKDRYKEGFLIAGNVDRSYKEYENDFIGLAEDVQTLKDFFLKEGVERFYLSRNQTLISPFNNAKGRGMESFGVPQTKIDKQTLSNSPNIIGNILGVDGERVINRAVETAGPFVAAARRNASNEQKSLILGKGPNPNLLGDSNSLKFMHSPFIREDRAGSLFSGYVRRDGDGSLNMVTILSNQLGRSSQMGIGKLPGTTLINADLIERQMSTSSDADLEQAPQDPDADPGPRNESSERRRIGSRIGQLARGAEDAFNNNRLSALRGGLNASIRDDIANGLYDTYNDSNQLQPIGDSFRVTPEVVKAVEEALEAQYVPFYFQDLRTNEILSFHAFLEDLRDTFTPEYKTNKFIGRVDPVVMYSGHTDRQITVSFVTYATSPADFTLLYEKVNRFIGFVYPQFDNGEEYRAEIGNGNDLQFRFVTGKTGKAYIPFSQKQKAGPLVRMRIGDIIKSRAYDDGVGFNPRLSVRAEEFLGIRDVLYIADAEGNSEVLNQLFEFNDSNSGDTIAETNEAIKEALLEQGFTEINGESVSSIEFIGENGQLTLPERFAEGSISSISVEGEIFEASARTSVQQEFVLKLSEFDAIVNGVIAEQQAAYTNNLQAVIRINELEATQRAINAGNAAIRKSFEAVGGRGLAGAVSNLQIALLNEFPWETSPGLRAPMGFKISFSFQVLHDVTPGLDAKGEMRPVYAPKIQDGPLFTANITTSPPFNPQIAASISGDSDLASRAARPPRIRGPRRSTTQSSTTIYGIIVSRNPDGNPYINVQQSRTASSPYITLEIEAQYLPVDKVPVSVHFREFELDQTGASQLPTVGNIFSRREALMSPAQVIEWEPLEPLDESDGSAGGTYPLIRLTCRVNANSALAPGTERLSEVSIRISSSGNSVPLTGAIPTRM